MDFRTSSRGRLPNVTVAETAPDGGGGAVAVVVEAVYEQSVRFGAHVWLIFWSFCVPPRCPFPMFKSVIVDTRRTESSPSLKAKIALSSEPIG